MPPQDHIPDPEVRQARELRRELESIASQIERHVTSLEDTALIRVERTALILRDAAGARRRELYEIRRQIDAIDCRFGIYFDGSDDAC